MHLSISKGWNLFWKSLSTSKMVDLEESQLFLAGDEALHVEESGGDIPKNLVAANKHFRRAVKGISIAMSALSSLNVIIFFGIFISIQVAQVSYTWQTTYAVLDIDVCVCIAPSQSPYTQT